VRVLNQGGKPADASTTRVAFTTFSGPVVVDVQTVALGGEGGFVDLEVPVPDNCFLSATGSVVPCHFEIDVDALFAVGEVFENNNRASGDCIAGIL